jgi:hypothetical protein
VSTFRLALGCVIAIVAAPFLVSGWVLSAAGHWLYAWADRLNPG